MNGVNPVGIKDVARAAGVSKTTVSHALSGKGRIPEQTRARVRKIAEELGYRPSPIARGLAAGRTGVLSLSVSIPPSLRGTYATIEYYAMLISGATAAAAGRGLALVIVPADGDPGIWERLVVDGAIVVEPTVDDRTIREVRGHGLPFVTIGRAPDLEGWWVDNDVAQASRVALDSLRVAGARRPAILTWDRRDSYTADACQAYQDWCGSHGVGPSIMRISGGQSEAPLEAVSRLLDADPPVDGVFALYERLGVAALECAAALGKSVPDDLRIVVGTDSGVGARTIPPLSAIEFHPDRLGAVAVGLLADCLEGRSETPEHRIIPADLVPRGST
jgi:DNA-binding LacI/PurR family transcriptional regulator